MRTNLYFKNMEYWFNYEAYRKYINDITGLMQHRITEEKDLLNELGEIIEEGYATELLWRYDRNKIKASWLRIKEWDYYYVLNNDFGITFTIADLGYIGFVAIAFLNFKNKTVEQFDHMSILPRGKMNLPPSSKSGGINIKNKKIDICFDRVDNERKITVDCPEFGLKAELNLFDENDESMVIATSWEKNRKKFYYNQKINCMPAEGIVEYNDKKYEFNKENSFAGLDWGRGNWTYKNRWYWGSASGMYEGKKLGWNIGYGFTDRSPASENMIFYDGQAHKIEDVLFEFNKDNYMEPWKFTSSDGRFEMDFESIVDRSSKTNLLLIKSEQHQVFGYYSGKLILDDGTEMVVDRFLGFAEDVLNWW